MSLPRYKIRDNFLEMKCVGYGFYAKPREKLNFNRSETDFFKHYS